MVKIYCLNILAKGETSAVWLKCSYDLADVGFFQKGSVQEFMAFFSKTIVERTQTATRQSVKQGEYTCHVYVRSDNLAGVVISNHDYPHRVAHTLVTKLLDEFVQKVPNWHNAKDESHVDFPQLQQYLTRYQNPREADSMTKIQEELDETKIIMHNTITAVLDRGEKLDDLVMKSENLSVQAKGFYKTARKTNSCCGYVG